jgi:hypothetical protein
MKYVCAFILTRLLDVCGAGISRRSSNAGESTVLIVGSFRRRSDEVVGRFFGVNRAGAVVDRGCVGGW